jgi:hypothetical protein
MEIYYFVRTLNQVKVLIIYWCLINVIITKYEHRQSSILLIKTIRDILNYYV